MRVENLIVATLEEESGEKIEDKRAYERCYTDLRRKSGNRWVGACCLDTIACAPYPRDQDGGIAAAILDVRAISARSQQR